MAMEGDSSLLCSLAASRVSFMLRYGSLTWESDVFD